MLSWIKSLILFGAPGPTRTGDLRFRKPLLYPAELRAREGLTATSGAYHKASGTAGARRGPRPPSTRSTDQRVLAHNGSRPRPEHPLGLVLVVAAAAERKVLDRGRPVQRMGMDVVELEVRPLGTPSSRRSHVRALTSIALPDGTLHVRRDVARRRLVRRVIRSRTDGTRRAWLVRHTHLRLLDVVKEQRDGTVEDRGGIAIRDLAAQERLEAAQLFVRLVANGELHAITLRRRGSHDRT